MNSASDQQPAPDHRPVVWAVGEPPAAPRAGRRGRLFRRSGLALGSGAAVVALVGALTAWSVTAPPGNDPVTPLWIAPGEATTPPAVTATTQDHDNGNDRSSRPSPSPARTADDHGQDDPASHDVKDDHGGERKAGSSSSRSGSDDHTSDDHGRRSGSDDHGSDDHGSKGGGSDDQGSDDSDGDDHGSSGHGSDDG